MKLPENDGLPGFDRRDEALFVQLYQRYSQAVYRNAMRFLHDTAEAEDIVQEVFLLLWDKRRQIDNERSVCGWLLTVSYRLAIDLLKKKGRQRSFSLVWPRTAETIRGEMFPEAHWQLVEEGIQRLSSQKRRVIQLCKLEGKSYQQAAVELGISKYTINEYLKEGMYFIRQYVRAR